MAIHIGYGGEATLSEEARDRTYLRGVKQTTVPGTNITGRTADEAYDMYKAQGATKEQLAEFARQVRAQFWGSFRQHNLQVIMDGLN